MKLISLKSYIIKMLLQRMSSKKEKIFEINFYADFIFFSINLGTSSSLSTRSSFFAFG